MAAKKRGFLHYRAYNFTNIDPARDAAKSVVLDSGLTYQEIYEAGGATVATQRRWFESGDPGSCRFSSLMATMRAAGGDITFTSPRGAQIKVVANKKR